MVPKGFQEGKSTHHIGLNKGCWPQDRTVHMGFRRKVGDRINVFFLEETIDEGAIANISLNKSEISFPFQIRQGGITATTAWKLRTYAQRQRQQ